MNWCIQGRFRNSSHIKSVSSARTTICTCYTTKTKSLLEFKPLCQYMNITVKCHTNTILTTYFECMWSSEWLYSTFIIHPHWGHPAAILEVKRWWNNQTDTDLYARRTGLANEKPPFDLKVRVPYWNVFMCIHEVLKNHSLWFKQAIWTQYSCPLQGHQGNDQQPVSQNATDKFYLELVRGWVQCLLTPIDTELNWSLVIRLTLS